MERFLGGPLLPTLFKLAVASVGVGVLLALFGIQPIDLWNNFIETVSRIWAMGFDLVDWSLRYFLLGAVVVLPIWAAVRLWALLFERKGGGDR